MAVALHRRLADQQIAQTNSAPITIPTGEEGARLTKFKNRVFNCGINTSDPLSCYKINYNSTTIQELANNIPVLRNEAFKLFIEFGTAPAREEVLQILLLLLKHDPHQENSSEGLLNFINEVAGCMKSIESQSAARCITLSRVYAAAIDCLVSHVKNGNYKAVRYQTQQDLQEALTILSRLDEAAEKSNPKLQYLTAYAKEAAKRLPTDAWIKAEIIKHVGDILACIVSLGYMAYQAHTHPNSSSKTDPVQLIKNTFLPIFSKIHLLQDWYDAVFLLKQMTRKVISRDRCSG